MIVNELASTQPSFDLQVRRDLDTSSSVTYHHQLVAIDFFLKMARSWSPHLILLCLTVCKNISHHASSAATDMVLPFIADSE